MAARRGTKPWNWRGDPIVEPRGYVIVFVGKGHHLADCRGYAYEHRLKAEEKLGRRLRKGEEIHHEGERHENDKIEVMPSRRHHFFRHRKGDKGKRHPDEPNPVTSCACGCGDTFLKYDTSNRPRRFVSGHNARAR